MFENVSNSSKSPKDIHSFIRRFEKRKSLTDKVDHSPDEKRIKLEHNEQRNAKKLDDKKIKSKDSFNDLSTLYQSKITTHYKTVKGNLSKQNSTKKKRNWDSFSSDEEFWISRYALKCNKSTSDIPVNGNTGKSDKHHSSLPITREEVRIDASDSRAVCPGSSAKKGRCQVLKNMTKENRKSSQHVKSESRNIDFNPNIVHKSQDNIMNFRRNMESKHFLCEGDTSSEKETTQISNGNARAVKNISAMIEDVKKGSTTQLCDKNCIEDKQKVKEILDKLFKQEKDENKTNSYVKDVSQHSDTAMNTFNKVEQVFPEKCVLRTEKNQLYDQKPVNKLMEHNMLDHHLGIEEILSEKQNSNKCDVVHAQLQSLHGQLFSRRKLEVGVPCKNGAACTKVTDKNKTESTNSSELEKPVIHKPLDGRSIIKMICSENNQDDKENGDNRQQMNKQFDRQQMNKQFEKLTPITKAKANMCKGNVQKGIQCHAAYGEVVQEKRNKGKNKKVSQQDEGSGNHNLSETAKNTKGVNTINYESNKYMKSNTYIKIPEEIHKLITKIEGQTEGTEQGREEMHKLLMKLKSQTEETDAINEPKCKAKLLETVDKICNDNEKNVAGRTCSSTSDVVKQCEIFFQIFNGSETAEASCNPGREKMDKRESSQTKKRSRSKTVPGQQLTLLQIFKKAASEIEQNNCGYRNIDKTAKYNQQQDITEQEFSLICNKCRNEESSERHSKISQEIDFNSNISAESKQKGDGLEENNSNSAKSDRSSYHHTTNIRTFKGNRLLKKREEIGQCKHAEKTKTMHMLDEITQLTGHVTNRQQPKIIQKVTTSQPEITKSTQYSSGVKLGKLSESNEVEECVAQNCSENDKSAAQNLVKKNSRKNCGKSRNMATNTCDAKIEKDYSHSIIRRLATTSDTIELNTDCSTINQAYPSSSILQSDQVRKEKTRKQSIDSSGTIGVKNPIFEVEQRRSHALEILQREKFTSNLNMQNFEGTEIGDCVSNLVSNFKNSSSENDCFENQSQIGNLKNSNEEKKFARISQNNDYMKTAPTNTSVSIQHDSQEKCSDRCNNVLKVLKENVSDKDTSKNGQKDKRDPLMNLISKVNNNSFKNVIESVPVYSQNRSNFPVFKCFMDENKKTKSVQVSQTIIRAKSKTTSLDKISHQGCFRNSTLKMNKVEHKHPRENNGHSNVEKNVAQYEKSMISHGAESLDVQQKNAAFGQDLSSAKDVLAPSGEASFEVTFDGKFLGRTKLHDGLEELKQIQLTKHSAENKEMKMENPCTNLLDDLKIDAEKNDANKTSAIGFCKQTKKLDIKNLEDQNVTNFSPETDDNNTISTVLTDHQQKSVDKILFELSCRTFDKTNDCSFRSVSNVDISKDVKGQGINLNSKNEVQSASDVENSRKIYEKSYSTVSIRTTEDQMVSRNLLLKAKHNFVVNSFRENEANEVQSVGNITNHQTFSNMLHGKIHHKSKDQLDITCFKNTFLSTLRSVTNCDVNIEAKSCVDIYKTDTQNSKPVFNDLFDPSGGDMSEELLIPTSVFLKQVSDSSQPSECVLGDQKDENNNIMASCDLSNHSLFVPESQFENPIETKKSQIISRKANELLADELVNTILTNNYEQCTRSKENNSSQTRDGVIGKLLKTTKGRKQKVKGIVKKYRKGKVKIYRLKKIKKLSKDMEQEEENLDFDDVFKKLTQDFQGSARCSSPPETFVSTPSSYVSVNTLRSETFSTGSKELGSFQRKLREGFNNISKDKSLLHSEDSIENLNALDRDGIKMKIQDIFLQIFNDLTSGRRAALKFRRQCYENCILKDGRLQLKPKGEALESVLSSTVTRSQMNFKLVICIMKKIQVLLETNSKLTKRELYYQLKDMINGQGVVDRAINLVSCILNVGMWALNIIAQKGLIFGNLKIMLSSGETINCNVPGTLIPQDINDIVEVHSDAYFILVVEKEAIFQKLLEEDIPNKLTRPFIMITGKGFPDLNTQLFLRKLWIIMSIPVFILVDADPHGINIMLNYRFGSVANAHVSHHLAVPKARWLGLLPSEMTKFNVKKQAMTNNEQKMVAKLLNTPYMKDNPGIVEELKILQQNNLKAGIEGLIKTDVFLSQVYLPYKFLHRNFI